jgi:hypothetical protein
MEGKHTKARPDLHGIRLIDVEFLEISEHALAGRCGTSTSETVTYDGDDFGCISIAVSTGSWFKLGKLIWRVAMMPFMPKDRKALGSFHSKFAERTVLLQKRALQC